MIEDAINKTDEFSPNDVLGGRYKIKKKIGSGATGKVYSASDKKLRRDVAIKVLDKKHYSNKEYVKRFEREAWAAAKLKQENIAQVYDVSELESLHYIIMELAEGKTLSKVIKEQETFFDSKEACKIMLDVAEGLRYAHDKGIIHRDIKPSNIIITEDKKVKITDFGIAKIIEKEGTPTNTLLTKDSSLLGTVQYTSPEQLRGKKVTGKTDVFSAGVVLYEMLTKRLPFDNVIDDSAEDENVENQSSGYSTDCATAISNILGKTLKGPKSINRRIPQTLEDIILKALEKKVEERYGAEGLYQALNSFIKDETVRVEGRFKRRFDLNRRQFLIKSGLGTVGLAVLIGTPTIIITKNKAYKESLYLPLDKMHEAQTWDEMKPYLKELETKLFDWILERSKYLKKDMGAFQFMENKTVLYKNNLHYGLHLTRDIYSLGFKETRNPLFLDLFSHYYDLVKFDETHTYQYYLDRFKIDYDMFKLLKDNNFKRINEFKDKMKSALQYLITERYNQTGKFFQYIQKNDETVDEQVLYACTQFYTAPLLIEGFKVFNIKKEFGIKPSEYLDFIINQTRTSNKILVGKDYGVHFGAFIYILSNQPPKFFFKAGHSNKAYLSDEIIKYLKHGLYPVIQLYNCIDENIENINRQKSSEKTNLEENITNLNTFDLKEFAQEKKEVTKTFFKILDFYKKHLISQKEAPYYIPIKGKGFNKENPLSLPPTGSYFNLLNSLLNDREILLNLNYLTQQEIEQFYKERTGVAKTICKRNNFNKRYLSSDHQSFFKRMLCDISDPMIIGYVETEKEFLEALLKIK